MTEFALDRSTFCVVFNFTLFVSGRNDNLTIFKRSKRLLLTYLLVIRYVPPYVVGNL